MRPPQPWPWHGRQLDQQADAPVTASRNKCPKLTAQAGSSAVIDRRQDNIPDRSLVTLRVHFLPNDHAGLVTELSGEHSSGRIGGIPDAGLDAGHQHVLWGFEPEAVKSNAYLFRNIFNRGAVIRTIEDGVGYHACTRREDSRCLVEQRRVDFLRHVRAIGGVRQALLGWHAVQVLADPITIQDTCSRRGTN